MTPQERQLIDELFDRLASLEGAPRDPKAVRAINEGLERAPHALYPLVQTVLVQDEALKRADARIRALESELGIQPAQPAPQGGFLDTMRDTLFGRREQHGSVPSVRPGMATQSGGVSGGVWGRGNAPSQPPTAYAQPAESQSQGGSFLGTAAATAAGVVGGALLMNSFRGMFGGQPHQTFGGMDQPGGRTPWGPDSSTSDAARQAGIDDIDRPGRAAAYDDPDSNQRPGLFDTAQHGADESADGGEFDTADDSDFGDIGGDSDTA